MIDDDEWLLRRVRPGSIDRDGRLGWHAFRLRPARSERGLSFYAASRCTPEQVASRAPTPGFGVVRLQVRMPRALGFEVDWAETTADSELGHAHVVAVPGVLEDGVHIPQAISASLAAQSAIVIPPA